MCVWLYVRMYYCYLQFSQYFNNEEYEATCYDKMLAQYEKASLKTTTSLALLNWGQNLVFSAGLTTIMLLAARDIANSKQNVVYTHLR